jgi:hypothetical protein
MEDELVTQMGLLLTRMDRVATALDQIAQATARYAGFAFAEAFTPGAGFGAPPLRDGALLVHVVNLRDLVASSGIAGFFEGLFGGIGRFFGGLIGGIVGGTVAGVALPVMIGQIAVIVGRVERIINRLGLGREMAVAAAGTTAPATPPPPSPPSVGGQLDELRDILSLVTGLFEAASSGGAVAESRRELIATPRVQQWQSMLLTVQAVVQGVTRVVRGLVILVPILVGSLALLIDKLDVIKLAFVEMLSFIVRNVMLLRGVVLVTVFDLLAATARLVSGLVQVIGLMVQGLLRAVFDMAATVLEGALSVFHFLAGALQRTVNGLLRWLVDTLFVVLARFGDLRIFRLVTHLVQVMPAVLPPLYELLKSDSSPALTEAQINALDRAAALALPSPEFPSDALPSTLLPTLPDVAELALPEAEVTRLRESLGTLRDGLLDGVGDLTNSVQSGFAALALRFDTMVNEELAHSQGDYADRLRAVRENADAFASAFSAAERALRERPASGMEAIAQAYEQWLAGPGLEGILGRITDFFRDTSATDAGSIPERIVDQPLDRPRASIDIDEVVIDLGPADDGDRGGAGDPETLLVMLREYLHDQQLRGGSPELLPA